MQFNEDNVPELNLEDPMDRYIGRQIAKAVLFRTRGDEPDAAFRVEFADRLLERCRAEA